MGSCNLVHAAPRSHRTPAAACSQLTALSKSTAPTGVPITMVPHLMKAVVTSSQPPCCLTWATPPPHLRPSNLEETPDTQHLLRGPPPPSSPIPHGILPPAGLSASLQVSQALAGFRTVVLLVPLPGPALHSSPGSHSSNTMSLGRPSLSTPSKVSITLRVALGLVASSSPLILLGIQIYEAPP